jgi:N-methylhydantoinase B/oxoprolinase/acetone carboxylase alpha subunit
MERKIEPPSEGDIRTTIAGNRDVRNRIIEHYKKLPLEEVADEMLAILSDRNRIMQKKELESTNAKWNEYLNREFDEM